MKNKEREKGAVKIIFNYAKKYFPYVIASLAAVIAVSLCEIFRADLLRGIIDEAQQGQLDAVLKLFLAGTAVWAAAVAAVYINRRLSGSFADEFRRVVGNAAGIGGCGRNDTGGIRPEERERPAKK